VQKISMTVVRRLKLRGVVKLALWIIALFLLWRAIQSQVLLEPLFLFLTAGQLPGTNVRLSPDTVLTALPFVFAGIVVAIFHRELWRLGSWIVRIIRRRPAPEVDLRHDESDVDLEKIVETSLQSEAASTPPAHHMPVAAAEVTAPVPAASPPEPSRFRLWWSGMVTVVSAFLQRLRKRYKPVVKRTHTYIRKHTHRLLIVIIPHLDKAAYYTGYGLGWLKRYTLQAWARGRVFARLAAKVIRTESRNLAVFVRATAIRFWRWLSPYLWQLDAWLGVKLEELLRQPYVRHGSRVVQDVKRDIIRLLKK
jgi:hypothetical protein